MFTGDAEADFGPGSVIVQDPGGIDVGVPLAFPQGTISGNDIQDLRLSYDAAADVMYVGFNMYAIATDVDSQAGPDATGPILAGLGGVDVPRVGGTEAFALLVDVDEDGTIDVIIGVSGATDIDGFTAAEFGGSPFAPGFAFAAPLAPHTGAVAGVPSALMPDIEFTVPNWSALPTSSGGDLTAQFAVTGFVGSFSDAGIGEDFTPGVNQFTPVCFPTAEICNNSDDDCDGEIDEGFDAGAVCNVGVGGCAAVGVQVCLPDGTVECSATQGDPRPETCNLIDDDCDGSTDENIGGSQCTTDLPGVCVDGQVACEDGQLACNPVTGPDAETCDNADNDCDGNTDEGFVVGEGCEVGVGACRVGGVTLCAPDGGIRCSGTPNSPNPETCDAIDNDCDGQTDEGYNLGDACSAGVGACEADGVVACDGQGDSACAAIPGNPVAEACNGADDDCDGVSDEGTGGSACNTGAPGVCANGIDACTNGILVCQGDNQPGAELCDTLDNDCDGQSDEGFNVGTPCQEGVGACQGNGVITCDANGASTCSATLGDPEAEVCDAVDNDCDGQTDEGLGLGDVCNVGVGACAVAGENICDDNGGIKCNAIAGQGDAESCNAIDDDCDGTIDEGLGLDEVCSVGIGACQSSGVTVCGDDAVVCDAQPGQPEAEVCDGADNDCDGQIDEGLGLGEGCSAGVGECAANGVNVCDGLGGVTCNATAESPKPEVCNGLDDDCDGSSDEKYGLGEACSAGVGACLADGEIACDGNGGSACNAQPGNPIAEVCDGGDNDCDGSTDEGTGGGDCATGAPGVCAAGDSVCVNGALECEPRVQPGAETCNTADDDCDGSVDEGFGIGELCSDGVGACAANGVTTCDGQGGAECSATQGDPRPETCDGTDEDCDGTTDEGTGGDACDSGQPGACGPGTTACANGALSCVPGNEPGVEVCNNADDDCDGNLDEGTGAGAPCQAGVGACMGNGVNVCDADGGIECSATQGDPQPETCDGIDNDCDGTTDEGLGLGDACNVGQGACGQAGELVCDGNGGVVCDAQPGQPGAEVCDNADNDCDGEVDEDLGLGEVCSVGIGACQSSGVNACDGNGGVTCDAQPGQPEAEVCDANDNDCDGNVDEGLGLGDACNEGIGACNVVGENVCDGLGGVTCNADPLEPKAETCDGTDQDCDGSVDEGTGVGEACNTGVGACAANGVNVCDANGGVECSATEGDPRPETCDGTDEDCDGTTDEGTGGDVCDSGEPGACGPGTTACVNGAPVCQAGQPGAEVCDNADNDCDGDIDEGTGAGEACQVGVGACAGNGVNVCDADGGVECSATQGDPRPETCDGTDEDCDGTTDEGTGGDVCDSGEPGACGPGTTTCVNGAPVCEPGNQPGAEVCDSADNDCDGSIDEGTGAGEACQVGVGACAGNGVNVCDANGGVECTATQGDPRPETCDGTDEDCDGTIDEGTGGDACDSGEPGACGPGTTACVDGAPVCEPGQPGAEVCDNTDNDCDGNIDEGTGAGEACQVGVGACAGNGVNVCDADGGVECSATQGDPRPETCDGSDEDCDGTVDEGTGGDVCDSGEPGACGPGTTACVNGAVTCEPSNQPGAEVCDNADNDCDGNIDEGTGAGEACQVGEGACAGNGVNVCDADGGVECSATQGDPRPETCDGTDEDCDGNTDEGMGGDACDSGEPGACGPGTTTCVDGALSCTPGNQPGAETCDNSDEDCDGNVDEGLGLGDACTVGVGACAGNGENVCDGNGGVTCNADAGQPVAETCNGVDDDCDGTVDEGTSGEACETGLAGACGPGTTACINGAPVCEPGVEPGVETCNATDDDCDGSIDEGFNVGDECEAGVGACNAVGTLECDENGGVTCLGNPYPPSDEVCNGSDDDCDGSTDEGLGLGDRCDVGVGECAAQGETVCGRNGAVACDAEPGAPVDEVCDGLDNDCDGNIDEGTGGEECDSGQPGACGPGTTICVTGQVVCDPTNEPGAETCDALDNDCDGSTDEGFGLGDECNAGQGACADTGRIVCDGNGEATCDAEPGQPGVETCNAADDDCDGSVDEGFNVGDACQAGQGACAGPGQIICRDGDAVCDAEGGDPEMEICDGLDNDCDGEIDENSPSRQFAADEYAANGHAVWLPNFYGDGAVTRLHFDDGIFTMRADGTASITGNATVHDGGVPGEVWYVDVDLTLRGRGPAFGGPKIERPAHQPPAITDLWFYYDIAAGTVSRGTLVADLTQRPADGRFPFQLGERANGKNNNLGASVWFDWVLFNGAERVRAGHGDINVNLDPLQVCDEICDAEAGEQPETCNNSDDDCDGIVDEGFDTGAACIVGVGECAAEGEQACGMDGEVVCEAMPGAPQDETCDGLDNDCDGSIDEGFGLGDACSAGVGACQVDGELACGADGNAICDAEPGAPADEVCDAVDNDCDGTTDEGLGLGEECAVGQGACGATGENVCGDDGAVICDAEPGNPVDEICDDNDNDCDGTADEGLGLGEACAAGVGACLVDGLTGCDDNGGVTCDAVPGNPVAEVCDGIDNDCDGSTDEGLGLGDACNVGVGACGNEGEQVCDGNGGVTCDAEPGAPAAETCNATDDDCDGSTDEGLGLGERCSEGEGACMTDGVNVCGDDGAVTCSATPGDPAAEVCDGVDNDCDGSTDEGLGLGDACTAGEGACANEGETVCGANGGVTCNAVPGIPVAEVCDAADNDCDGSTDEGLGLGDACTVGVGACGNDGEQVCDGNGGVTCDAEPGAPVAEACDAIDNDCDGTTDEDLGLGERCSEGEGACMTDGVNVCGDDGAVTCSATPGDPAAETCDAIDNDCDGTTDEGLGLGDACNAGEGACAAEGEQVCDGNGGVTCDAEPGAPQDEICDATDNDCDGNIDEGLGLGDECSAGEGECAATGRTVCGDDGQVTCDAEPVDPMAELCDGLDNDCDGAIDEEGPRQVYAASEFLNGHAFWLPNLYQAGKLVRMRLRDGAEMVVADGVARLTGTAYIFNNSGGPGEIGEEWDVNIAFAFRGVGDAFGGPKTNRPEQTPEVTADWIYYDMIVGDAVMRRGDTELRLTQMPADGRFPFQVGNWANMMNGSLGGASWFFWHKFVDGVEVSDGRGDVNLDLVAIDACVEICDPAVGEPLPETCDGRDNDCDGVADEGFDLGDVCVTGEGACGAVGETICNDAGDGVTCDAEPGAPADETCDEVDNDCDGTADEGLGLGERCEDGVGACAASGETVCGENGDVVCDAEPGQPADETCDALDNDCDASSDEGLGLGEPCTVGQGACAANGENICDGNGGVTCSADPVEPGVETCDGVDNDCDGNIDEGFGLGEACNEGQGACAAVGEVVCDGNGGATCDAEPAQPGAELCDDMDNDCDGFTDEGFGVGERCAAGQGACRNIGERVCDANGGVLCDAEAGDPSDELCDEEDNDCDGLIDEDFDLDGDCSVGLGECKRDGQRICGEDDVVAGLGGNLVLNGSFEQPELNRDWAVFQEIEGWTTIAGNGIEVQRINDAANGEQYVELDSHPTPGGGCMMQQIPVDIGGIYRLSISHSARPNVGDNRVALYWDGVEVAELDADGRGLNNTQWTRHSYDVTGNSNSATLVICDVTNDRDTLGGFVDNVTLEMVEGIMCDADPGEPEDERCDALDNDCDGYVDEDLGIGDECQVGVGACANIGARQCDEDGEVICAGRAGDPVDEACDDVDNDCDGIVDEGVCDEEPPCEDEAPGTRIYQVTAWDDDQYGLYLPNWNEQGHRTDMLFRDGATFTVRADGTATVTGTAYVNNLGGGAGQLGEEWAVVMNFELRGTGAEFGGPYRERPEVQPAEVTDLWTYYNLTGGTFTRGDIVATLSQYPENGRFPFQMGQWANGRSDTFGASNWYRWTRNNADGSASSSIGDMNINLDEICVSPEPEECSECDGKVTRMTLRNDGPAGRIVVEQRREGVIFDRQVAAGESFELVGVDDRGTLGTEVNVSVDGGDATRIHTSCSVEIGPGSVFGDFIVMEAFSRNGGRICGDVPACEPQDEVCNQADDDCDGEIDEGLDCGGAPVCPQVVVLDFETDADGEAIDAGRDLSDVYAGYGARLATYNRAGDSDGLGIAFDSANPTGGDPDLGTPNRDFGGPGRGAGGERGREGENSQPLHNLLIRAENTVDNNDDGHVDVPDDHGQGARFDYTFENTVCVYGVDLVDVEEGERGASFEFFDADGARIDLVRAGGLGNNSYEHVDLDVCGVRMMRTTLIGSGAIDNIEFCVDPNAQPPICEVGSSFAVDEYSADGHAFVFPNFEGNNRTVRMHLRDDARFVIRGDDAVLTGTAFRTDNGDEYTVDVRFAYRGQGAEFGGPKIERPQWQTDDVTALWRYFDMTEATLMHDGVEVVTLTQMPADGRYPLQVGMAANGKNQGLGMSSWYTWVRENPRCRYNGTGDINVNLQDTCE